MRIGIFGGTFDPPHLGHLIPVAASAEQARLDQVWLMPTFIPPHKSRADITDSYHRAAMVALAIQHYPNFRLSTYELTLGRMSFTVDTIQELKKNLPGADSIHFIIGTDSFLEIDTWHQWQNLIQLCDFIIINRGTGERELNEKLEYLENALQTQVRNKFLFVKTPYLPISSTEIRAGASRKESLSGLVTPEVALYIERHALYKRR
jgi:nicotinate-nucleotide adenylyltransferase